MIPGSDVSGVVEAVADDVVGFAVGDEVFGMLRFPSFGDGAAYAEYVTAPAAGPSPADTTERQERARQWRRGRRRAHRSPAR
ncbi:hypothetical protein TUM20985_09550 [Mycobacterium antarcticum]|nr:hypothetical protein TUM20985_09550 [Mycolicibacterium sp. TUM20985]GLP73848.1 hypothetical protein TUM20983_09580 [Mycolicibacterium sp. TUM20983]GLP79532.1 hypothetical protein TUM20984_09520 [Mycolicibacterium sp. TUM20984]